MNSFHQQRRLSVSSPSILGSFLLLVLFHLRLLVLVPGAFALGAPQCGRKGGDDTPLVLDGNAAGVGTTTSRSLLQDRSLIAGGQPASDCEWPWHVGILQRVRENAFSYRCGGSLIGEQHVLTAGHCVDDPALRGNENGGGTRNTNTNTNNVGALYVFVGSASLNLQDLVNSGQLQRHVVRVQSVVMHPRYAEESADRLYDYAILRLLAPGKPERDPGSTIVVDSLMDLIGAGVGATPDLDRNLIPELVKETCSGGSSRELYVRSGTRAPLSTGAHAQSPSSTTTSTTSSSSTTASTISTTTAHEDHSNARVAFVCLPDRPLESEPVIRKYFEDESFVGDLATLVDNIGSSGEFDGNGESKLEEYECVVTGWGTQGAGLQSSTSIRALAGWRGGLGGEGGPPRTLQDLIKSTRWTFALQETHIQLEEHCSKFKYADEDFMSQFLQKVRGDNFPSVLCGQGKNIASNENYAGSATCPGDSGSPLVCRKGGGSWVQYGIVSAGRSVDGTALEHCLVSGELQTWFMDTYYVRDWIVEVANLQPSVVPFVQPPNRTLAYLVLLLLFVFVGVWMIQCARGQGTSCCHWCCAKTGDGASKDKAGEAASGTAGGPGAVAGGPPRGGHGRRMISSHSLSDGSFIMGQPVYIPHGAHRVGGSFLRIDGDDENHDVSSAAAGSLQFAHGGPSRDAYSLTSGGGSRGVAMSYPTGGHIPGQLYPITLGRGSSGPDRSGGVGLFEQGGLDEADRGNTAGGMDDENVTYVKSDGAGVAEIERRVRWAVAMHEGNSNHVLRVRAGRETFDLNPSEAHVLLPAILQREDLTFRRSPPGRLLEDVDDSSLVELEVRSPHQPMHGGNHQDLRAVEGADGKGAVML